MLANIESHKKAVSPKDTLVSINNPRRGLQHARFEGTRRALWVPMPQFFRAPFSIWLHKPLASSTITATDEASPTKLAPVCTSRPSLRFCCSRLPQRHTDSSGPLHERNVRLLHRLNCASEVEPSRDKAHVVATTRQRCFPGFPSLWSGSPNVLLKQSLSIFTAILMRELISASSALRMADARDIGRVGGLFAVAQQRSRRGSPPPAQRGSGVLLVYTLWCTTLQQRGN